MPEIVMNSNIPTMLGVKETAEMFGISQNYARQLALSGSVKAVRVGRNKILINCDSLKEFFENSYINKPEPTLDCSSTVNLRKSSIQPIPVKL